MTRKHYEMIADAIFVASLGAGPCQKEGVTAAAEHIAHVLDKDNPRFNRLRFLKAAGVIG